MSEKQRAIIAYLYQLRDTPQSPPDPRLSLPVIAERLGMTQKEVKKNASGLMKRHHVSYVIVERRRYYYILPRGIREIQKLTRKRTEIEISSKRIGIKKEKREED